MSDYNAANNPMAARPIPQEEQPVQQFKPFEPQPSPDQAGVTVIENGTYPAEDVVESLKDVIDPELGINIVDLGLLYGVKINEDNSVDIDMTLTSAACPLTDVIERQAQMVLGSFTDEVRINWVWMPPWTPERITDDGRDMMRALGFAI